MTSDLQGSKERLSNGGLKSEGEKQKSLRKRSYFFLHAKYRIKCFNVLSYNNYDGQYSTQYASLKNICMPLFAVQNYTHKINTNSHTLVGPLWLCSDPAAEGADGVIQRPGAAVVVTVVRVCETIWWLFVVCLAQQGVEAIVEAGTEANVSGVAGAVQRAVVVLRCGEQALVLVVVGGLVEVVLLQGGEQSRFVFVY